MLQRLQGELKNDGKWCSETWKGVGGTSRSSSLPTSGAQLERKRSKEDRNEMKEIILSLDRLKWRRKMRGAPSSGNLLKRLLNSHPCQVDLGADKAIMWRGPRWVILMAPNPNERNGKSDTGGISNSHSREMNRSELLWPRVWGKALWLRGGGECSRCCCVLPNDLCLWESNKM